MTCRERGCGDGYQLTGCRVCLCVVAQGDGRKEDSQEDGPEKGINASRCDYSMKLVAWAIHLRVHCSIYSQYRGRNDVNLASTVVLEASFWNVHVCIPLVPRSCTE